MNQLFTPNYNFSITLLGGQSHLWYFEDGIYTGSLQNSLVRIKPLGDKILWQTYPQNDNEELVRKYLRLADDYEFILSKINKDHYTKSAVKKYYGLRLVKQDFDETVLCFILATFKNIPSIRQSIRKLSEMYGRKITIENKSYFLFPSTKAIADSNLNDLAKTGIGYRAKYLKHTAQMLLEFDLKNTIYKLSEEEARRELKKLSGVGDKVADCVLVFSLGFEHISPIDIWAKRYLEKFYELDPKNSYTHTRNWLINYFDGYAAWGGQFLFEYIRNLKNDRNYIDRKISEL